MMISYLEGNKKHLALHLEIVFVITYVNTLQSPFYANIYRNNPKSTLSFEINPGVDFVRSCKIQTHFNYLKEKKALKPR